MAREQLGGVVDGPEGCLCLLREMNGLSRAARVAIVLEEVGLLLVHAGHGTAELVHVIDEAAEIVCLPMGDQFQAGRGTALLRPPRRTRGVRA